MSAPPSGRSLLPLAPLWALFCVAGCGPPHYQYRTEETTYVVLSRDAGVEGAPDGTGIVRPVDHRFEVRYTGRAAIERGGVERTRLLFDVRAVNAGSLDLVVERRGILLRDTAGKTWPPADVVEPSRIVGGVEETTSLAFDMPLDFDFRAEPRLDLEIPYTHGGASYICRARLRRELPAPVHYDPYYYHYDHAYFYHYPHGHYHHHRFGCPGPAYGPRFRFGFGYSYRH